ncbi:MAG: hypothetical protein V4527_11165 [Pseudomonadota bacterium]
MNTSSINPVFDAVYAHAAPYSHRLNRRQDVQRGRIYLAWPEKAGLVTALVIAVLSALACATVLFAAGTLSFSKLNYALAMWSGAAELTIAVPIWLLMRAIDFAANGPARRRADRKSLAA